MFKLFIIATILGVTCAQFSLGVNGGGNGRGRGNAGGDGDADLDGSLGSDGRQGGRLNIDGVEDGRFGGRLGGRYGGRQGGQQNGVDENGRQGNSHNGHGQSSDGLGGMLNGLPGVGGVLGGNRNGRSGNGGGLGGMLGNLPVVGGMLGGNGRGENGGGLGGMLGNLPVVGGLLGGNGNGGGLGGMLGGLNGQIGSTVYNALSGLQALENLKKDAMIKGVNMGTDMLGGLPGGELMQDVGHGVSGALDGMRNHVIGYLETAKVKVNGGLGLGASGDHDDNNERSNRITREVVPEVRF